MKPLFLTIALLFSSPAWAGEVDGNSFFCKPVGITFFIEHYAISFEDGKVRQYNGSKERRPKKYKVSPFHVNWFNFSYYLKIDRKNLVLRVKDMSTQDFEDFQCEFMEFSKAKEIVKKLETLRLDPKGNKF